LIPAANITAWRSRAPWPEDNQVEQDLILSRLMIEIAKHDLLGDELSMRGGTCLHKLHLPAPLRYSEDLDYVRRTNSGVGPILDAVREIAEGMGLKDRGTQLGGQMAHARTSRRPRRCLPGPPFHSLSTHRGGGGRVQSRRLRSRS